MCFSIGKGANASLMETEQQPLTAAWKQIQTKPKLGPVHPGPGQNLPKQPLSPKE